MIPEMPARAMLGWLGNADDVRGVRVFDCKSVARKMKLRDVRAGRQVDPRLGFVAGLVVILGDPLANFAGSDANDRVVVGVVVSVPAEDFHAEAALLERPFAGERMFNDIAEEIRVAAAVLERRMSEDSLELFKDDFAFRVIGREPPVLVRRQLIQDMQA